MEIFSTYGKIKMIDMPVDRLNPHLSKGYAYVEFENPDDAEKALKHMDGGKYWPARSLGAFKSLQSRCIWSENFLELIGMSLVNWCKVLSVFSPNGFCEVQDRSKKSQNY